MKFSLPPRWGIRIVAVWAVILAVLAISYLLLLSVSIELYSNLYQNQVYVWIIFMLNVGFTVGFSASAYGLWQQQNWGRVLFLWLIVIWTGVNLLSLLVPDLFLTSVQRPALALTLDLIRYAVALFVPLVYLNLPHIKTCFASQPVESA